MIDPERRPYVPTREVRLTPLDESGAPSGESYPLRGVTSIEWSCELEGFSEEAFHLILGISAHRWRRMSKLGRSRIGGCN